MSSRAEILFHPIVDTAGYRIVAHWCDAGGRVDVAIRAAAAQSAAGLYFIKTCSLNPGCGAIREAMRESALRPGNVVLEIPVLAVVRDPRRWLSAYDSYRHAGFPTSAGGCHSGNAHGRDQSILTYLMVCGPAGTATIRRLRERPLFS